MSARWTLRAEHASGEIKLAATDNRLVAFMTVDEARALRNQLEVAIALANFYHHDRPRKEFIR